MTHPAGSVLSVVPVGPSSPPFCSPESEAKLVSSPDQLRVRYDSAPGSGGRPRLPLTPGLCPPSCQSLGVRCPQLCPHRVAVCIKQSGHRDRRTGAPPGQASPHLASPRLPPPGPSGAGAPRQPERGPSLRPAASPLLAWRPVRVCRWPGPLASFVARHGLEGLWRAVRRRGRFTNTLLVPDSRLWSVTLGSNEYAEIRSNPKRGQGRPRPAAQFPPGPFAGPSRPSTPSTSHSRRTRETQAPSRPYSA